MEAEIGEEGEKGRSWSEGVESSRLINAAVE